MQKRFGLGIFIFLLAATALTGCKENSKPTQLNAEAFGMKIFDLLKSKDYNGLADYLVDEADLEEMASLENDPRYSKLSREEIEKTRNSLHENFFTRLNAFEKAGLDAGVKLEQLGTVTCHARLDSKANLQTTDITLDLKRDGFLNVKITILMAVFLSGEWLLVHPPMWSRE